MSKKNDGPMMNIGGDPNDASYRYQMPVLETRVEGRGNGIKTRVVNMETVASSLQRPPEYPTKWFGAILGAQTTASAKRHDFIVNGEHTAGTLQQTLEGFIKKYVLCPKCGLPETSLIVRKRDLYSKCRSCGDLSKLEATDRVAQYIINNPPPPPKDDKSTQTREAQLAAKLAKEEDARRERERRRKAKGKAPTKVAPAANDAGGWAVDTSAEAVMARREGELSDKLQAATMGADEEALNERVADAVKDRKVPAAEVVEALKALQEETKIPDEALMPLVVEARFTKDLHKEVLPDIDLLRFLAADENRQHQFIAEFERLAVRFKIKKFGDILYGLYDKDVLKESSLFKWYDHGSSLSVSTEDYQNLRSQAMQFINCLRDSDDDDEEEEEEDEEEKVNDEAANARAALISKPVDEDLEAEIDDL